MGGLRRGRRRLSLNSLAECCLGLGPRSSPRNLALLSRRFAVNAVDLLVLHAEGDQAQAALASLDLARLSLGVVAISGGGRRASAGAQEVHAAALHGCRGGALHALS